MSFTNSQNGTFELLRGVNLDVEKGKITALIGGNGTGKTTLFDIISGLVKGYTGDVIMEGNKINHLSAYRISLMGIGRLFQDGQLLSGLTLMENMKLASYDTTGEMPFSSLIWHKKYKSTEAAKEQHAKEILVRIFGEGNKYLEMLDLDASAFSYGEQRILSLVCLLMGNNRLLLLDEPTSGVNPVYFETMEKIIREMKEQEGLTVLLIENSIDFVLNVADICAYLDGGVIEKFGPTTEVLNKNYWIIGNLNL